MGFNAYPALSIKSPDLSRVLATVAALKGAGLKNQLMQSKIAKNKRVSGLLGELQSEPSGSGIYGALQSGGGPTPRAATALDEGVDQRNKAIFGKLALIDPKGTGEMLDTMDKLSARELNQKREKLGAAAAIATRVLTTNEGLERAQIYKGALKAAKDMGLDISNLSPTYQGAQTDRMLEMIIMTATGYENYSKQRREDMKNRVRIVDPKTGRLQLVMPNDVNAAYRAGGKDFQKPTSLQQNAAFVAGNDPDAQRALVKESMMKPQTMIQIGAASPQGKLAADLMALKRSGKGDSPEARAMERQIAASGGGFTDKETLRKGKLKLANFSDVLDRYEGLIDKFGAEIMPGPDKRTLGATRTELLLEAKELFNLGVLNGPDLELMERIISNPTTVGAKVAEVASDVLGSDVGGRKTFKAEIKVLRDKVKQVGKRLIESFGGTAIEQTGLPTNSAFDEMNIEELGSVDLSKIPPDQLSAYTKRARALKKEAMATAGKASK